MNTLPSSESRGYVMPWARREAREDRNGIVTDRERNDTVRLKRREVRLQLHELRFAEGSPRRAAMDNDHRALAAPRGAEHDRLAVLIREGEIGEHLADGGAGREGWRGGNSHDVSPLRCKRGHILMNNRPGDLFPQRQPQAPRGEREKKNLLSLFLRSWRLICSFRPGGVGQRSWRSSPVNLLASLRRTNEAGGGIGKTPPLSGSPSFQYAGAPISGMSSPVSSSSGVS